MDKLQEKELLQLQQMQDKSKESCTTSFRILHSLLQVLSYKKAESAGGFERAFASLFDQDYEIFSGTMLINLDQLEKYLVKEEFQELESVNAFRVLCEPFHPFLRSRFSFNTFEEQLGRKCFNAYTKTDVQPFHDTLVQHMESLK